MLGSRNQIALTAQQIASCQRAWQVLCGEQARTLIVSEAALFGSRTRFNADKNVVYLGADAFASMFAASANSRMSMLACLAHELAHMERFEAGYVRPYTGQGRLLDEAETSIRASFAPALSSRDRADLVEDAKDRLLDWLAEEQRMRNDENRT